MKNLDVVRLYNLLSLIQSQQEIAFQAAVKSPFGEAPASFSVKAAYNVGLLKPQIQVIQSALEGPWDQTIQAFAAEEAKLALRHSDLPEDTAITPNFQFPIKDPAAFEAEQKELRARHPGLDDALRDRGVAQEVLQQESPALVLWKAKLDELPSVLTMDHGSILLPMLEGPPSS